MFYARCILWHSFWESMVDFLIEGCLLSCVFVPAGRRARDGVYAADA
jgi:hypothetical protein